MDNLINFCDLTNKSSAKKYTQILQNDFNNENRNQYLIATILYTESYGLPLILKEAFACTIQNRIKQNRNQRITISQFLMDENYYPNLNADILIPNITDAEFAICSRLAGRALRLCLTDITYGSTFFHHENDFPKFAENHGHIAQIKDYLFYKI